MNTQTIFPIIGTLVLLIILIALMITIFKYSKWEIKNIKKMKKDVDNAKKAVTDNHVRRNVPFIKTPNVTKEGEDDND